MMGDSEKEATMDVDTQETGKSGTDKTAKLMRDQHEANVENAGVIIQHTMDTVRTTGVDKSVIEILKTVRHWPSMANKTDPGAFEPAFAATEISAEEFAEEGVTGIRVSFSYSGRGYGIAARVKKDSSSEITFGSITLRENGDRVFSMETVQDKHYEHISFRGLNAFKYGKWIENMVAIEKEIELYRAQSG